MSELKEIKNKFTAAVHGTDDLVFREFTYQDLHGFVLYLDSLVDEKWLEDIFFKQLNQAPASKRSLQEALASASYEKKATIAECVPLLYKGQAAIVFYERGPSFFMVDAALSINRGIEEPTNERALQGTHEGFVESLLVNLHLVRRQATTEALIVRQKKVGKTIKKDVAIVYMHDRASDTVLAEIMKKLKAIDQDLTISPGVINELLQDSKRSIFPQILYSERPDVVVGNIAEGRIALLIEGNPTALILPVSFFSFLQAVDDYNFHFFLGSFLRSVRLLALCIAIFVPSLYISLVAFHFEIIPQPLIISVKSSLQNIPYPPLVEALIMEVTIELIREAGVRLPAPIGQTIGIVGGLVIGEAVVNAGLVSNMMIIVVAITAIASYVIPNTEMSSVVRLIRFPLMLASAAFGLLGVILSFFAILMHLVKLDSFGTPYFLPLAPFSLKGVKDGLLRFPYWLIQRHTRYASPYSKRESRKGG